MPLYEYQCRACGHGFETLVRGTEQPACPACQSHDIERLLSSFGVSSEARSHSTLQTARRDFTYSTGPTGPDQARDRNMLGTTCRRTTACACPSSKD